MFIFYRPSIIGFKSPATPIMEGIIDLHNYIFFYLILVFIIVFYMYCYIIYSAYIIPTFFYDFYFIPYKNSELIFFKKILFFFGLNSEMVEKNKLQSYRLHFYYNYLLSIFKSHFYYQALIRHTEILESRKINEHMLIEIVWTIIPTIILILIAIPSFTLLYAMDEIIDPKLTVKIIGYQWFWSYEYAQAYDIIEFDYLKDILGYKNRFYRDYLIYDSVMLTEDELQLGYHRLLEVDRKLILPVKTHIKFLITGADVIHSWAVPSFGIKVDAVPGRMSQIGAYIKYEGVFYGQCSELCGVNHGFMPIAVKVVGYSNFLKWYRHVDIIWNDIN
jgi:heme/copper-type cytochrome/quinol oxidase subunit 2